MYLGFLKFVPLKFVLEYLSSKHISFFLFFRAGVSKLRYIGHSMGTTALFVMFHHYPEMKNTISHVTAIAPVAYLRNLGGRIYWFTAAANSLFRLMNLLNHWALLSPKYIPGYCFAAFFVLQVSNYLCLSLD